MNESCKIVQQASESSVTILCNGKLSEESLDSLAESIAAARQTNCSVVMDLSEVTLVDRKAARYLADKSFGGIKIVNCPEYLEDWLMRVRDES